MQICYANCLISFRVRLSPKMSLRWRKPSIVDYFSRTAVTELGGLNENKIVYISASDCNKPHKGNFWFCGLGQARESPVRHSLCSIACLGFTSILKVTIDVQIQNIRCFVHWIMPHFNGKRLIIKMNWDDFFKSMIHQRYHQLVRWYSRPILSHRCTMRYKLYH